MKNLVACTLFLVFVLPANAGYDANITGTVTKVLTYPLDGRVYIELNNQPATHPEFNRRFFAIDESTNTVAANRLYARLLVAFASERPVTIGYDSQGGVVPTRISVCTASDR